VKKQLTNGAEIWSAERIKELTMSRITARNPVQTRIRRPIATLVACAVLVLTMSISALAANAFGVRDLVGNFFGWNINEDVGVLELDTTGQGIKSTWGGDGSTYEMTLESLTLSPTEMTFSYTFKSNNGKTPLPTKLEVWLSDGTTVEATITETSIVGDLLTGTATFPSPVNLDAASAVELGGPNDLMYVGLIIPVNSDVPWTDSLPTTNDKAEFSIDVHSGEAP